MIAFVVRACASAPIAVIQHLRPRRNANQAAATQTGPILRTTDEVNAANLEQGQAVTTRPTTTPPVTNPTNGVPTAADSPWSTAAEYRFERYTVKRDFPRVGIQKKKY